MNQLVDMLASRRSVKVKKLAEPAPDASQLEKILQIGMRVPDHGKLAPWRIKVFDTSAQAAFGDLCAKRFSELHEDAREKQIEHERRRPQRAPLLLAVMFEPVIGRIPLWEQQLSMGAVCMNILHAAHAMGFAGQWLSEWIAYDEVICAALAESNEAEIAGFIYIGTATEVPDDRTRPDIDTIVSNWAPAPAKP